jgi:hypothetical protein
MRGIAPVLPVASEALHPPGTSENAGQCCDEVSRRRANGQ